MNRVHSRWRAPKRKLSEKQKAQRLAAIEGKKIKRSTEGEQKTDAATTEPVPSSSTTEKK